MSTGGSWRVLRQDDNGNIYVVACGMSEREARRRAMEFTARAHKQTYSLDEVEDGSLPGSRLA